MRNEKLHNAREVVLGIVNVSRGDLLTNTRDIRNTVCWRLEQLIGPWEENLEIPTDMSPFQFGVSIGEKYKDRINFDDKTRLVPATLSIVEELLQKSEASLLKGSPAP